MAAIPITITGILFDKHGRTSQLVTLMGEASYTGLGVGGGPMPPESQPPGIWGGSNEGFPTQPGPLPPTGIWPGPGGPSQGPGFPTPPIYFPPFVPPGMKPPEAPEPGDPTMAVPGNWPTQPIAPPEYLIVNYPGIGPVVVAPPAPPEAQPKPA